MAFFKILGGVTPSTNVVGTMTQGIGHPLREIDDAPAGVSVSLVSEELLDAPSFVSQNPSGLGIPLVLSFGAPQSNTNINLNALGELTFLVDGDYTVRITLQLGRSSNPGDSILMGRATLNNFPISNTLHAAIGSISEVLPLSFEGVVPASAGDVLRIELVRDAAGIDNGGVFTQVASTAGWSDSPSCVMQVSHFVVTVT